MSYAGFALQTGIYNRLSAQLDQEVYTQWAPHEAAMPYVVLGDIETVMGDTKTTDAQESVFSVHCFEKDTRSRKPTEDMLTAIHAALHEQNANIAVAGYSVTLCRMEFADAFQQSGEAAGQNSYYHGVMRFRIRLVKNA